MLTMTVAVNERGRRVGQSPHRGKLTNHDVDLMLGMHDEGWSYKRLSRTFEISKSQVCNTIKGRQRCQTPTSLR